MPGGRKLEVVKKNMYPWHDTCPDVPTSLSVSHKLYQRHTHTQTDCIIL